MCSLASARARLPVLVPKEPRTPLLPGERVLGRVSSRLATGACRRHRRALQADSNTRLRRSARKAHVLVVDLGQHETSTCRHQPPPGRA